MTEPERIASLLDDQRARWQRGEPLSVEAFLEQHSDFRDDPDVVLDLIYNEILLREQHGETPNLSEYAQRFPQLAREVRMQFEVHGALCPEGAAVTPACDVHVLQPQELPERTTAVPGYEILDELGRGGMGVVYRARQTALKRLVALKMILAGVHASPRVRERFRIEAEAVARLEHSNIVHIFEIGEHDGQPILTLELVEGGNLAQQMGGKPQPPRPAAELMETLSRAMHHAHLHGIVHRDLKPANILLQQDLSQRRQDAKQDKEETNEERSRNSALLSSFAPLRLGERSSFIPKITDFGLAKLLDSTSGATPTEAFVGTPNYMAPEQARGEAKNIGPAADIYALGAILYELLTGRAPFQGATVFDTLEQVRSTEPVPPSCLQPKVPRDLETICLKCLEKEADRRYASALDLADDLHRFLSEEPIRARPTSIARQTLKWVRRRPALAALVVVIFVAVLSVGGLLGWHTADRAAHQREQDKIEHELAEEKARQEAQARYRTFIHQRDEALFHTVVGTPQFTGLDPVASLNAARQATEQALAAVSGDDGLLATSPFWSERERAEVRGGCYELLLVLADALLRASPHQPGAPPPEVEEAGRYLEWAGRLAPPTWAYRRRRARFLERTGDVPGADRELQQAQTLKPTSAADRFLLGDEYYRDHHVKKARHEFDQALHQQSDHFWAQYYVALCDLETKSTWAAEAGLTACLGRRPDFVWTYVVRGFANSQLHEFEDAEGDFQIGLGLNPNVAAQYGLLVNRGTLYMEWGRLDAAKDDLERARALNPGPHPAYLNLAMLARRRKDDAAALHWLAEALRRNPPPGDQAAAFANRGDILYRQQQYDEAIRACAAALEADPDHTQALGVLAQAMLKKGQYREAEKAFTDYLDKEGKPHPDIFRGRANARSELGDYAAALQDYSRLLPDRPGAEPPDVDLYNHRGWAYVFEDAWKLALADFETALKGDAKNVEPLIGRGLCRVMLGDYRQAVPDAEAAWEHHPTTPQMMHNLGCIFAQAAGRAAGDRDALDNAKQASQYRSRAVQALEEALRMVPVEQRNSFWRDRMSPDPVLDPIRESAEFREMAQRYAGNKLPE